MVVEGDAGEELQVRVALPHHGHRRHVPAEKTPFSQCPCVIEMANLTPSSRSDISLRTDQKSFQPSAFRISFS